jgi:hypothetical protein
LIVRRREPVFLAGQPLIEGIGHLVRRARRLLARAEILLAEQMPADRVRSA